MIHIFCEPDDAAALWLAAVLSARGAPVSVSLPEELIIGSRLNLEVGDGPPHPTIALASGITLSPEETTGIVARMVAFPLPELPNACDLDLVYAAEEARAALVAWFAAWACPIIGRPDPYTPWGDGTAAGEWRVIAANSGVLIRTEDHAEAAADDAQFDLLVTAEGVFAAEGHSAEPEAAAAAQTLFALQRDAVAVFRFLPSPVGPVFDCPVPLADFRAFGTVVPDMFAAGAGS